MKRFLLVFICLLFSFVSAQEVNLRGYDEFDIPKGTFIPVISLQEFSSAYCEEGDKVAFKSTSDIFMYDKNVIPQGSIFLGYIDKKNEPIIGTHASMKIFLNKIILKNGENIPIKAFIYSSNNNILGGGLTAPAKYIKMPHYQRWSMFRAMGVLQYVPGPERKMGEHITIASGADFMVVLVAPIHMIHTQFN